MTQKLTAIGEFGKDIKLYQNFFQESLPAHVDISRFIGSVLSAAKKDPKILSCDRSSVYSVCKMAAQDGLMLDGREAAIVPYGRTATYIPMVAGLLRLIHNSGLVKSVMAQIVRKNDEFSYNPASGEAPFHNPDWFGDRGEMLGAYAVAHMHGGGVICEIMHIDEINKVRSMSRNTMAKRPWDEWTGEMARKSVIRRIYKYIPSSPEMDRILEHENEIYSMARLDNGDNSLLSRNARKGKTRAAAIIEAAELVEVEQDSSEEESGEEK